MAHGYTREQMRRKKKGKITPMKAEYWEGVDNEKDNKAGRSLTNC